RIVDGKAAGLVFIRCWIALSTSAGRLSASSLHGGRAVAPNPNIAFVIDRDSVVRLGPIEALTRTAPMADQVAFKIELEDRVRGRATLGGRRFRSRVQLAGFERAGAVNDPDVILGVDRYADSLSENPMVRQRLRPQRIDFEPRRRGGSGLDCRLLI